MASAQITLKLEPLEYERVKRSLARDRDAQNALSESHEAPLTPKDRHLARIEALGLTEILAKI